MSKRASNYKSSAAEFGRRLTALYKLKIFPRMGKEFAEELFRAGIGAGAEIRALSSIKDAGNKIRVATDAIVLLNQTAFAAQVMVDGGFYTAEQIAPVNAYIEKLIDALSGLIASVKVRQSGEDRPGKTRNQRIIVEQKPVVRRKVLVNSSQNIPDEPTYTKGEQTSMPLDVPASEDVAFSDTGTNDYDPDGFSEPYKK